MKKKISIIIIIFLIIIGLVFVGVMSQFGKNVDQNEVEIKTNKDIIYELFNNFPESNKIYYTSNNLYSDRSIGPTIYQIDILAELTEEAYNEFISETEFETTDDFEIKINPNNRNYNWKKMKNTNIIKSKNSEKASVRSIYLDETTKTIYIIAVGGN